MRDLPNADRARVERKKVVEYLLNEDHPDGKSKAAFFRRFGFRRRRWRQLADALRAHAVANGVAVSKPSAYGTRYVADGPLQTPDGRTPSVRTVWITENVSDAPRLITAYPS